MQSTTPAAGRVGNPANKNQNPASTIDLAKNTNRSVGRLTSLWTAGRPGRLDSDFPEETPIGKEFRGKEGKEDVYELLRQKGIWIRFGLYLFYMALFASLVLGLPPKQLLLLS